MNVINISFLKILIQFILSSIIHSNRVNHFKFSQLKKALDISKLGVKEHNKKSSILDLYFIQKIKNPKLREFLTRNHELTPDFNNYYSIKYKAPNYSEKNSKIEINISDKDLIKDKFNIYSNIDKSDIIQGDYKKNDLLVKFFNKKNNPKEEEKIKYLKNKYDNNKEVINKGKIDVNNGKNNYIIKNNLDRNPIPNNFHFHENNDIPFHQYQRLDDEFVYDNPNVNNYPPGGGNFHPSMDPRASLLHSSNGHGHHSHHTHHHSHHNYGGYQTYSNTPKQKSRLSEYMGSFYQIMIVVFFFGFIYRIIYGNRQNDKHALAWYDENKDYFKERYETVGLIEDQDIGCYRKDDNMKENVLIKENPDNYKLICANYRYIKFIEINLQFQKKFDMSLLFTSIFIPIKDKIIYKVAFNQVDPLGWVFCFGKKNQCTSIKDSFEIMSYYCQIYEPKFMDTYMCLISEDEEIFTELFNNKNLMQYYKCCESFIDSIYYSDAINIYTEENNIYFTFDIDLSENYPTRIFLEITHFVNVFVDCFAQIKYTKEFRDKVNNNRLMFKENQIKNSMKKEIEEKEKKDFIEKWKIKNNMKGKSEFERKKLQKKLKKYK